MGFFQMIADWIKPAVRVVRKVVDKVDEWLNGPSISDEYGKLTRNFPVEEGRQRAPSSSVDFMAALDAKAVNAKLNEVDRKIGAVEQKMQDHSQQQVIANKTLSLQSDVMKLAVCAGGFDRYTNNIRLHASNLSIHLQTIRNVKGLTDDVNALRFGLKRAIGTINHMANIINTNGHGQVNKIEGVDIEIEDGAISLNAAYRAFEKTRDLLVEEIVAVSELAEEHLHDVRAVQQKAAELGNVGQQVINFLDEKIVPKLIQAKKMGLLLKQEVDALPVIPKGEAGSTR